VLQILGSGITPCKFRHPESGIRHKHNLLRVRLQKIKQKFIKFAKLLCLMFSVFSIILKKPLILVLLARKKSHSTILKLCTLFLEVNDPVSGMQVSRIRDPGMKS
jgi:hypothetical protein